MPALPTRTDLSGTPSKATAQAAHVAVYDYLSGLFSATGTAAAARTALGLDSLLTAKANLASAAFTGQVTSTAGNVNLVTSTALADIAATLTAAQLFGGEFTITPTVARILTTDTAANIIAALAGSVDNSNFQFVVINNAAFDVTLAAGVGVTLVGRVVINSGSATWRVRRTSATTVSFTRIEGAAAAIGVGINQTWQVLTASRATATTYTNSTGKPIFVLISSVFTSSVLTIAGLSVANPNTTQQNTISFVVPDGISYSITGIASFTWSELR